MSCVDESDYSYFFFDCRFHLQSGHLCRCTKSCGNHGCRQTESHETATEEDFMLVVEQRMPWATDLCSSPYGKQTVWRFLESFSKPTLPLFLKHLSLSREIRDSRGSHLIQKIAVIDSGKHNVDILKRLEHEFVELCVHSCANYAITSICSNIRRDDLDYLIHLAAPHATRLSMNRHGAYVLQAILHRSVCFEKQVQHNKTFQDMIADLVDIGLPLVMNKYGNYSAQALIPCLNAENLNQDAKRFATMLANNFLICVSDRAGSRVVEKMLEEGCAISKRTIIRAIVDLNDDNFKLFRKRESSVFVIQKALNAAQRHLKRRILHKFRQ